MDINIILYFVAFFFSMIIGYFSIAKLERSCLRHGWIDAPNFRKVHTQPIPRLGGLVFMPTAAVSSLLILGIKKWVLHSDTMIHSSSLLMALGALAIYLVGLIDDFHELKANTKFAIQFAAALILPLCNLLISDLHGFLGIHQIPFIASYPITIFVILLITNAMNLIDGIDGLASGLSIMMLACFSVLFFNIGAEVFTTVSVATLGAVMIFFYFNMWKKPGHGKIFMGDSGSLFLGYVIAYLAIKYQMPQGKIPYMENALLYSYTLVIVPTFDVIRVALMRKMRGMDMFSPDKTHIHHLLIATGLSMRQTLAVILCLFWVFCGLNYLLNEAGTDINLIVLCDILLYSAVIGIAMLMKRK